MGGSAAPCATVGAGRFRQLRAGRFRQLSGEATVARTSQETTRQLAARRGKSGGRWASSARGRGGQDGGAYRTPGRSADGNAARSTDRNGPTVGEEPPCVAGVREALAAEKLSALRRRALVRAMAELMLSSC
jgi:hypothetical protein